MRIAIVGTGISGLTCAHLLHRDFDPVIYEKNDYVGGHTHTVDVRAGDAGYAVDTGFIVCNEWTYPNFLALMAELGVELQPTVMSFSVRCERTGLEYNGTSLNSLFAQRLNVLRPGFHRMIRDILRFNREAPSLLDHPDPGITLGAYLTAENYSDEFRRFYIVPMGAAIWSSPGQSIEDFPAVFFVRFFKNHGMLTVNDRPQWYSIRHGSRTYVDALIRPFRDRIRLSCPVTGVRRETDRVVVRAADGSTEAYDEVIFACHSDEALAMLEDASDDEQRLLGALPYQPNRTVLHTDTSIMPRHRVVWGSWNYHIPADSRDRVAVTYDMNILQALEAPETFLVTLNYDEDIDPGRRLGTFEYAHPQFTPASIAAQEAWDRISGVNRTHYCGAYWRNGFHEDGVFSGLRVCRRFGKELSAP